ncbi:right-handed parallel beta-helix repeat-containing protein [Hyunsoonleella ulvae]|uniref:hypothetical protein n=1 Tax=Hyunsoonleella ulvae TaxID=2799948 RepID=UPI00193ABC2D|nr:hypothetical protein [Hyunsoonleella ulvae]
MKTKITILATALLLSFISGAQNIITVDNSVGANAQYSDLQSAISAASNGDTIYVHASETNYGIININKQLTIIGFSHGDADKKTFIDDIVLLDNASNSKFSGLYITDDVYTNNSTVLTGIVIENCYIDSVLLFSNAGVDDILVRGNIIYQIGSTSASSNNNNYTNAIISNNIILYYIGLKNYNSITIKNNVFLGPYFDYPVYNARSVDGSVTAQNNIFYFNRSSSFDPNAAGVIFENCLTYNLGSGSITALSGSNNINDQNPNFVSADDTSFNPAIDNYNLQAGSPAIGSGTGGVDMGIYDGSVFSFNNSGFTNGIPTVKITNITDRIAPEANLSVTIDTNAN